MYVNRKSLSSAQPRSSFSVVRVLSSRPCLCAAAQAAFGSLHGKPGEPLQVLGTPPLSLRHLRVRRLSLFLLGRSYKAALGGLQHRRKT